jgi:Flp pilus assembly protein TadD
LLYARAALHLRPGFDSAELLLSEILGALERPAEAISAYRTIPPHSPLHWSMRLRVAANLDELDRNEEAVAELRAMAAERPERTDALMALGSLMRSKERWVEAVAAYDEAIARIAKPEERHWRALYARGIALERSKQWQRGEQDFLKALELRPDQPYVMNYLGYSWVDKGVNLDRALKMIERAVELRPNDGYIIDSLGWALYRMGKFEDSAEHLERAVELRPGDPTINDHLGDAYWRVGRRIEARFQWRRALALEPEEEETVATIEAKLLNGLSPSAAADDGT